MGADIYTETLTSDSFNVNPGTNAVTPRRPRVPDHAAYVQGGVPGLQGRPRPPRGGEVFELLQTHWSPTARLFASLSGAAMLLWGWRRLDLPGILLTAGGVVVLLRGVRNEPLTSLEARGRG